MDPVESLIVDLLEWIGPGERPYMEVQEVWRTSCPKLPVWEDAMDAGYLERRFQQGQGTSVAVSPSGKAFLAACGRGRSFADPASAV